MTQPTHFIEVWKRERLVTSATIPVAFLKQNLNYTKAIGGTTIAVWKIKWKKCL
jgi:hypothetical protein